MIKKLPSLNRPLSARRYISTPNPMAAAKYQKALMHETRLNDLYRQNQTSEQFIDDVENFIQESLLQVKDEFQRFRVYQNAFDYLIQKYQTHNKEMQLVKTGYDKVIDNLMEKYKVRNNYRIMVQQSFTSLNNELQKKQAHFDKKKKGFADLIYSVKSTSSDIREEIQDLRKQLIKDTAEMNVSQNTANYNQSKLDHLSKKVNKIKNEEKEITEWIKVNKIRKVQLEEEFKNSQIHLSDVLDSISDSNKHIERTRASISELEERIQNADNQIKKKNDFLSQKSEECGEIGKEIISLNERSQLIQNDMINLCSELGVILESAGISNRQISMIGQDPIKLVALAVSKKRGYTNGIDPDLLDNLQ